MSTAVTVKLRDVKSIVAEFIRGTFLFGSDEYDLNDDHSLMEAGVVDSTGILELAAFLESRFKITVEDTEFIPENLDTLNNISAYIVRKANGVSLSKVEQG